MVTLAIQKLEDVGAYVMSLVCDAPAVHQSLLKCLGANLSSCDLNSTLTIDCIDHPVFALLDNPHSIKNIRNSWESLGTIYTKSGDAIRWQYLVELYNVQSQRGLTAANKLNVNHIQFHNQKQKVSYATQLFRKA